jgi:signal transduction histidine kinase
MQNNAKVKRRQCAEWSRDQLPLYTAQTLIGEDSGQLLDLLNMVSQIAAVGGCILDVDNNRLSCTQEIRRIFDIDTLESLHLNSVIGLFDEQARPTITLAVQQCIDSGQAFNFEFPVTSARGRMLWVRTHGHAEWDSTRVVKIFLWFQDITECIQRLNSQAMLELKLREHTSMLSEALEAARLAERTRVAILANVSHELRTPLNTITGFSHLARRTCTESQQLNYLEKIVHAGITLDRIIGDLLNMSKLASSKTICEAVPFSLRRTIERCMGLAVALVGNKKLSVTHKVDNGAPDSLIGDQRYFEQIVLNLLSNAVKFTNAGTVELRVTLKQIIANRAYLRIEIEDTGIGICEQKLDSLFLPFSQPDTSMTRAYGGIGLGLALSKHLTEKMGGQISVSSRQGIGSTFCVELWFEF